MDIKATPTGYQFEATSINRDLPEKENGKHRWVATSMFIVSQENAENAFDKKVKKLLDQENYLATYIGCWDCEMLLMEPGDAITHCPAKAAEFR